MRHLIPLKYIWRPWLLYIIINSLFVLKYCSRISISIGIVSTIMYAIGVIAVFEILSHHRKISKNTVICTMLIIGIVLIIAQNIINPYHLQVDRWSAIHNFIDYLFHGTYPYAARTHLGGYGSPFPIWQFFHIPFYLLGNVGLSVFFCLFLYFASLYRHITSTSLLHLAILLLLSPALIYEVLVRSDLMSNFLLVAAMINYLYFNKIELRNHWLSISIMIGFILSTRLSAAIPFAVYLLYSYLKQIWYVKVMMAIIVLITFTVTFLPFVFWNGQMLFFFQYNPFILQTRQGSFIVILIFACLLAPLSFSWKNNYYKMNRNITFALCSLVAMTFIYNMYDTNTWTELFQSKYDITYFDMAMPFLSISICTNSKVNQFKE